MIDILNKYLVQHKNINIPGLGTLYLERLSAQADPVNKQILPPRYTVRFDKYFDAPDKAFFTYLASQRKVPDYEAIKLYNQFAQDIRSKIKAEEKALWKDMGFFSKDSSGDIIFEPVYESLQPFTPVTAAIIQRETVVEPAPETDAVASDTEPVIVENELVAEPASGRNLWWVYAIILGVIGLAILFFQLYKYGFSWEMISNHQPLRN